MAVKFDVKTHGMRQKIADLRAMEARLSDLSPVLKAGAEGFREQIDASFEQGRTPWGVPWQPLADSTIEQKRKLGRSLKPLIRRGHLRSRITARAEKGAVVFGFSPTTPYGAFHQDGRGVPERTFLPRSDAELRGPIGTWRTKLHDRVVRYVITGAR